MTKTDEAQPIEETAPEQEHTLTTEDARAAIAQDQQQRMEAAMRALQAVQAQYRVRFDWVETWRNGQLVEAALKIMPTD